MAITDDINGLVTEMSQRKEFFEAHEHLKVMSNELVTKLAAFEYIKNKGSFDTIPQSLKVVMLRWEAAFQACKTELMADQEIVEIYGWEK